MSFVHHQHTRQQRRRLRRLALLVRREARASARGASAPGPLRAAPAVRRRRARQRCVAARTGRARPGRVLGRAGAELHWDKPFTTVLDDSNPPFYKWFTDGTLNVSYNCLDRHVEAGRGNRVAFHWAGEEGEQRAITYAELHRDVQRLANALKELGVGKGDVVGIYLPMIPEVVVAMLACARIGAPHNVVFGGFAPEAVKERMEVSHAKVLITVDGARRKGKTAPVKAAVDAVMGDLESLEHIVVVRHTRHRRADERRPRRVLRRDPRRGGPGLPGGADGGRAPAVHPLLLGLDRQAEGDRPHHRRVPDRRQLHPPVRVRPRPRARRVLLLGRRRLDHRALLHRLRPARATARRA